MKFLFSVGHLGKDTGAQTADVGDVYGGGLAVNQERYINLQQFNGIAAAYLSNPVLDCFFVVAGDGYSALGLRDRLIIEPVPFGLTERATLANDLGASLVEIHNNAAADNRARGAEVIAWSEKSAGYAMGGAIMKRLESVGIKNRGVKTCAELGRNLTILQKTAKPSIITEIGFISNPSEINDLDVDLDGFNERAGALIYRGLVDYAEQNGVI